LEKLVARSICLGPESQHLSARHLARFVSTRKKALARQILGQHRIMQLCRCHIARCSHESSSHRRSKHSVLFIEIRRNRANLWPDRALEVMLATHSQQPRSQGLQPRADFLFCRLSRGAPRSRNELSETGALDEAQIELRETKAKIWEQTNKTPRARRLSIYGGGGVHQGTFPVVPDHCKRIPISRGKTA